MSELPSAYTCATPVACKDHKCCECHGRILTNEMYHKHSGIWDGEARTFKVCSDCEALREELNKSIRDIYERIWLGGLWEYVIEARDDALKARFEAIQQKRSPAAGKEVGR